jgi:transcriptional regulator with XRE-family HTH domain
MNDDRRRVPGLRREELALLAGVSASYYSRLEQGQAPHASPEVLDALARALGLDDAERLHLHRLATVTRRTSAGRRPAPERVTPAVRQLLAAIGDVPALVLGRRGDVLAWNRAGHALFAGHLDPDAPDHPRQRPTMARLVFLDPHTRDLYADWPAKARAVVATLREASGRHPGGHADLGAAQRGPHDPGRHRGRRRQEPSGGRVLAPAEDRLSGPARRGRRPSGGRRPGDQHSSTPSTPTFAWRPRPATPPAPASSSWSRAASGHCSRPTSSTLRCSCWNRAMTAVSARIRPPPARPGARCSDGPPTPARWCCRPT